MSNKVDEMMEYALKCEEEDEKRMRNKQKSISIVESACRRLEEEQCDDPTCEGCVSRYIVISAARECERWKLSDAALLDVNDYLSARLKKADARIESLKAFINACLDCKSADELHDFVLFNAEDVLVEEKK